MWEVGISEFHVAALYPNFLSEIKVLGCFKILVDCLNLVGSTLFTLASLKGED